MSENHIIISEHLYESSWTLDSLSGDWRTTVNTRSLSYCLLNATAHSSNSTLGIAVLFYQDETGNMSALLQRDLGSGNGGGTEWIDYTRSGSSPLPDAFRITPSNDLHSSSPTLYESNTNVKVTTPFSCTKNIGQTLVKLLYYSPNPTSPLNCVAYQSGFTTGMYFAYPYPHYTRHFEINNM